jgi:hypothetical protein
MSYQWLCLQIPEKQYIADGMWFLMADVLVTHAMNEGVSHAH